MRKVSVVLLVVISALYMGSTVSTIFHLGVGYAVASVSPFEGVSLQHSAVVADIDTLWGGGRILYSLDYAFVEEVMLDAKLWNFFALYDYKGFSHEVYAGGYTFDFGAIEIGLGAGYDVMGGNIAGVLRFSTALGALKFSGWAYTFFGSSGGFSLGGKMSYRFWGIPVTVGFESSKGLGYYYLGLGYSIEKIVVPIEIEIKKGEYGLNFLEGDPVRISLKVKRKDMKGEVQAFLVREEDGRKISLGSFDVEEGGKTFEEKLRYPGRYTVKLVPKGDLTLDYRSPRIWVHELPRVSFGFGRYLPVGETAKGTIELRASEGEKYLVSVYDGSRKVYEGEVDLKEGKATVRFNIDTNRRRETTIRLLVYGRERKRRSVKIGAEVNYKVSAKEHALVGDEVELRLEKRGGEVEPFEGDYVEVYVGHKKVGEIDVGKETAVFRVSMEKGKYSINFRPSDEFEVKAYGTRSITFHEKPQVILDLPKGYVGVGERAIGRFRLVTRSEDVYYVRVIDEGGNEVFRGTVRSNETEEFKLDTSRPAEKVYKLEVYGKILKEGRIAIGGKASYRILANVGNDVFEDEKLTLRIREKDFADYLKGKEVDVYLKKGDYVSKVGSFKIGDGEVLMTVDLRKHFGGPGTYVVELRAGGGVMLEYNEVRFRVHEVPDVLVKLEGVNRGVVSKGDRVLMKVTLKAKMEREYEVRVKGEGLDEKRTVRIFKPEEFELDTESVGHRVYKVYVYGRLFEVRKFDVADEFRVDILNRSVKKSIKKRTGISILDLYYDPIRLKVKDSEGKPVAGLVLNYRATYYRMLENATETDVVEEGSMMTDANGEAVLDLPLYPTIVNVEIYPENPYISLKASDPLYSLGKSVTFQMVLISAVKKIEIGGSSENMVEAGKTIYLYYSGKRRERYEIPIHKIVPGGYLDRLRKKLGLKWKDYKDSVIKKFFQNLYLEIEPKVFEKGRFEDARGIKIERVVDLTADYLNVSFSFSETPKPIFLRFTVRDKKGEILYKDFVRLIYIGNPTIKTVSAEVKRGGYSRVIAEVKSDFGPIPYIGVKLTVRGSRFGEAVFRSITDRDGKAYFVIPPIPYDDSVELEYQLFVPGGGDISIVEKDKVRVIESSGEGEIEVSLPQVIDVDWDGKVGGKVSIDIYKLLRNVVISYRGIPFIEIPEISGYDLYKLLEDLKKVVYIGEGNDRRLEARVYFPQPGVEAVVAVYAAKGTIEDRGKEKLLGVFKVKDRGKVSFRVPSDYKEIYFVAVDKNYVPKKWEYSQSKVIQMNEEGVRIPIELIVNVHSHDWKNTMTYSLYIRGDFYGMAFRGIENTVVLSNEDVEKLKERTMRNVVVYSISGEKFTKPRFRGDSLSFRVDLKSKSIRMKNELAGMRILFIRSEEDRIGESEGIGILRDTWYGIPLYSTMFKESDDLFMGDGEYQVVAYYPDSDVFLRKDVEVDLRKKQLADVFKGDISAAKVVVNFEGIKESFIGSLLEKKKMRYQIRVDEGMLIDGNMADESAVQRELFLTQGIHKIVIRVNDFFEDGELLLKVLEGGGKQTQIYVMPRVANEEWGTVEKSENVVVLYSSGVHRDRKADNTIRIGLRPDYKVFTVKFKKPGHLALIPSEYMETGFLKLSKDKVEALGMDLPRDDFASGYLKGVLVPTAFVEEPKDTPPEVVVGEGSVVSFIVFQPVLNTAPMFICAEGNYLLRRIMVSSSDRFTFKQLNYRTISLEGEGFPFRIHLGEIKSYFGETGAEGEEFEEELVEKMGGLEVRIWGEVELKGENGEKEIYRVPFGGEEARRSPCDVRIVEILDVNTDTWITDEVILHRGVKYYINFRESTRVFEMKENVNPEDMPGVRKRREGKHEYYELDFRMLPGR